MSNQGRAVDPLKTASLTMRYTTDQVSKLLRFDPKDQLALLALYGVPKDVAAKTKIPQSVLGCSNDFKYVDKKIHEFVKPLLSKDGNDGDKENVKPSKGTSCSRWERDMYKSHIGQLQQQSLEIRTKHKENAASVPSSASSNTVTPPLPPTTADDTAEEEAAIEKAMEEDSAEFRRRLHDATFVNPPLPPPTNSSSNVLRERPRNTSTGLFSDASDRRKDLHMDRKDTGKKRKQGENASTIAGTFDSVARPALYSGISKFGTAIDTTRMPGLKPHEPGVRSLSMVRIDVTPCGTDGGRAKKAEKPTFVLIGSSKDDIKCVFEAYEQCCKHANGAEKHGFRFFPFIADRSEDGTVSTGIQEFISKQNESRKRACTHARSFEQVYQDEDM